VDLFQDVRHLRGLPGKFASLLVQCMEGLHQRSDWILQDAPGRRRLKTRGTRQEFLERFPLTRQTIMYVVYRSPALVFPRCSSHSRRVVAESIQQISGNSLIWQIQRSRQCRLGFVEFPNSGSNAIQQLPDTGILSCGGG
jgi:hypothetical protein